VTINQLAELVMHIAGKKLEIRHIKGPLGVRGRNSTTTSSLKTPLAPLPPAHRRPGNHLCLVDQQVSKSRAALVA